MTNSRGPTPPLMLRAPVDDDVRFVTSSWLNSFREAGAFNKHVGNDLYFAQHHSLIAALWNDPRTTKLLAVFPEDTAFIYGWLVGTGSDVGPIVHYTYVRNSMRGRGVATALVNAFGQGADGFVSHLTPAWEALERGMDGPRFRYSPYLAFTDFMFPGSNG